MGMMSEISIENLTLTKEVVLDQARARLFSPNILVINYLNDSEVGIEEIKILIDHFIDTANRKPFITIVDIRDIRGNMTAEAMEYITNHKESQNLKIAEAILVNSLGMRLLANFYLKIKTQSGPTHVFNDESKALAWLKEMELVQNALRSMN